MKRIIGNVTEAVTELQLGRLLAIPTETVYGLAADATNEEAVRAIFTVKSRPMNHPLIMHVGANTELSEWVKPLPEYAIALMRSFWPGPLTLVCRLQSGSRLSPLVTGGQDSVAIRCPAHPLALEILERLQRPIVAPSANRFGRTSPTQPEHVLDDFPDASFLILDGGPCQVGIESTIIDVRSPEGFQILRHGLIHSEMISQHTFPIPEINRADAPNVPGSLKQHYQPLKPAFYMPAEQFEHTDPSSPVIQDADILCFSSPPQNKAAICRLLPCPEMAAHAFYRELRRADAGPGKHILIELPGLASAWDGLRDRITRAGKPVGTAGRPLRSN